MSLIALAAAAISLICPGTAEKDGSSTTTAIVGGSVGIATSGTRVDFDDSVSFRLNEDGTGSARLPKRIQPMYKQGGKDGWFPLVNVKKTDDEITGQVRFHSMYKPRFRLDRITGQIVLTGDLGDFSGQCQAFDPATVQRKF